MATLTDALGKSLADTLYQPKPAALQQAVIVRPASPTWDDAAKTFTIPASTSVDYYEWQGIYGWILKAAGTHTRSGDGTLTNHLETSILARPKAGYATAGPTLVRHLYPSL